MLSQQVQSALAIAWPDSVAQTYQRVVGVDVEIALKAVHLAVDVGDKDFHS